MVGRLHDAAPISSAGVVLSQPTSSTTPSIGLPRMDSSTSMLARLRNSLAVERSLRFSGILISILGYSDIADRPAGTSAAIDLPHIFIIFILYEIKLS